ncbi:hypothetical protein [Lachnoanaerobaculum sp.]|nr:hypothetical protein [Lachnoanaerobaculum sp.]
MKLTDAEKAERKEYNKKIGSRIREARDAEGITQEDLASACGLIA